MYAELKQMNKLAKRRIYKAANKEHFANYEFARGLRRNYGITVEEYNALFQYQNGKCALCSKHQSEFKRRLHVDHDHSTGQVRALLCTKCNPLIGYADESIERLQAAIGYLSKFKK